MSVKTRLTTKVQPELQRGRIMPQICQFLGVNSVTNIELPGGFMPALIYIFADWLENFPSGRFQEGFLQNQAAAGVETAHPNAEWPFAPVFKTSGNLPID
ncbi:hypothetical protein Q1J45_22375 [Pseudomonas rhodesiae]|uniref:hypothetical protein n=2 Tax=Pseudomonas TaxID=286 RepID=UPI002737152F|nr:hypothetical protein [Pseudomonas sp. FP2254]WLH43580.1 hypothetical protein PSH94_19285 [Pseudomonas sp. FP2254]